MSKSLLEEKTITRVVKKAVVDTLYEIMRDPDFGLELQEWVKRRLAKKPKRTVSLEALRKKYL